MITCLYHLAFNVICIFIVILTSSQRHFCVFALSFPGVDALKTIYLSILNGHLDMHSIGGSVLKLSERLTEAAIALNSKVCRLKDSLLLCSTVSLCHSVLSIFCWI